MNPSGQSQQFLNTINFGDLDFTEAGDMDDLLLSEACETTENEYIVLNDLTFYYRHKWSNNSKHQGRTVEILWQLDNRCELPLNNIQSPNDVKFQAPEVYRSCDLNGISAAAREAGKCEH